jgi:hypothetical protein
MSDRVNINAEQIKADGAFQNDMSKITSVDDIVRPRRNRFGNGLKGLYITRRAGNTNRPHPLLPRQNVSSHASKLSEDANSRLRLQTKRLSSIISKQPKLRLLNLKTRRRATRTDVLSNAVGSWTTAVLKSHVNPNSS